MKNLQTRNKVVAVVPAAGLGQRFGPGMKKPFQTLGGEPLIIRALKTLESVNEIIEIIPVLKSEDMEFGQRLFEEAGLMKIRRVAPGGKERQDSVYNGLKQIEDADSIVLIHDGVRPLLSPSLAAALIKKMSEAIRSKEDCDGIIPGVPVKDTIKEAEDGFVKKTLQRGSLWAVQTPQVFLCKKIQRAYENAVKEGYYATDDAALIERYGGKVKIVRGSYTNIKITTPEDLYIAEAFLKIDTKSNTLHTH
jgi:2-C-methyl-D-erythritol 4-phosphate cytidylyltransferase